MVTRWLLYGYYVVTRWLLGCYQMVTRWLLDATRCYQMVTRWLLDDYQMVTRWLLWLLDGYQMVTGWLLDGYQMVTFIFYIALYKHWIKPKGQSRTDNPEKLATPGRQDTGRRQAKRKTQHRKLKR